MYRSTFRVSRRAAFAIVLGSATVSAAGAATFHRYAVSQGTGSLGATNFLQSSTSGGALEGNVGSADTGISIPFGVLGAIDVASPSPFGIGVVGVTTSGYGVAAESLDSNPSILAYPGGSGIGLEATTTSGSANPAIFGEAKGTAAGIIGSTLDAYSGVGILGQDLSNGNQYSVGVKGTTTNGGYGVVGMSGNGGGPGVGGIASTAAGIQGVSESSDGVVGFSSNPSPPPAPYEYAGVYGSANAGPGLAGTSASGLALYGATTGSLGSEVVAEGDFGTGMQVDARFIGFLTYADPTVGSFPVIGAEIQGTSNGIEASESSSTGHPLSLYGGSSGDTEVAYIDNSGDLAIHGTMTTFADVRGGSQVSSFVPRSAAPTIEDVGSGHLSNGVAAIRIDPLMVASLDQSHAYHVFLTPEGDTKGLFVAQKTPQGFIVRETQGGRGTFDFDYRIVGTADGHGNDRIALTPARPTRSQHLALERASLARIPRHTFHALSTVETISEKKTAFLRNHPNVVRLKAYRAPAIVDPLKGLRMHR